MSAGLSQDLNFGEKDDSTLGWKQPSSPPDEGHREEFDRLSKMIDSITIEDGDETRGTSDDQVTQPSTVTTTVVTRATNVPIQTPRPTQTPTDDIIDKANKQVAVKDANTVSKTSDDRLLEMEGRLTEKITSQLDKKLATGYD